jgi:ABC-type transporter Mla subunit MlaD
VVSSSSSEISSFRPRRKLFGYEREATDQFLARTAELLEQAGKRLAQVEAELAEQREQERSLKEALLAAATIADAIKQHARGEADAIRAEARELDAFVATTRSYLSAFLRETLERLETVSSEIEAARERVDHFPDEKTMEVPDTSEEVAASAETKQDDGSRPDDGSPGAGDSILERLRQYRVDTRDSPHPPEA